METFATVVFKSAAIPEKPGKYISIEKGPSAVKEPKIRISLIYFFVVIFLKYCLKFHSKIIIYYLVIYNNFFYAKSGLLY